MGLYNSLPSGEIMWKQRVKTKPNVKPLYPDLFLQDPNNPDFSYAFFEEGIICLSKDENGLNLFRIRPYPNYAWKVGDPPLMGLWRKIYNEKHFTPKQINE